MNPPPVTPLCEADNATFWAWHRWPEFSRWPNREETLVVVPLAGTADWGLGHALDAEEQVLMRVLREASEKRPPALPLLVVPPLRFVLGPDPGCAFAVDLSVAHALVAEVLGSIAASGFKKVVLYNSSPWNEEFIAAAARDNRITLGLQIFRISLSGIGLDLHPVRSSSRRDFQTVVTALVGTEPEVSARALPPLARHWGDERIEPLSESALTLSQAEVDGPKIVAAAANKLLKLLQEIQCRDPLPHGGRIMPATI